MHYSFWINSRCSYVTFDSPSLNIKSLEHNLKQVPYSIIYKHGLHNKKYYLLSTYHVHFLVSVFSYCTQMFNLDVLSKALCELLSVHHFVKGYYTGKYWMAIVL